MMTEPARKALGERRLGIAIVLLATIAWASAGLFVRLLPFDIWSIIVWRNALAVVFAGGYVLFRLGRRTWPAIRGLGLPGALAAPWSTATIIMFPAAFQHASAGNVVTIYASLPFVTAVVAWLWFREKPSVATLVAGSIALLGVVIMVGPQASGPRLGDLLAVPLAGEVGAFGPRDIVVAAGFALFPITLGMMLYVIGSAKIPSTLAALIQTLEAPFGVFWAWAGVGEIPPTATIIGGILVLSGVFGRLLAEARSRDAT
jgi:drug/metabolite transporter (DMT)-like permease